MEWIEYPATDHSILRYRVESGQRTPTALHPDALRDRVLWIAERLRVEPVGQPALARAVVAVIL